VTSAKFNKNGEIYKIKRIRQCCKQIWTHCFSVVTYYVVSYYRFLNAVPGWPDLTFFANMAIFRGLGYFCSVIYSAIFDLNYGRWHITEYLIHLEHFLLFSLVWLYPIMFLAVKLFDLIDALDTVVNILWFHGPNPPNPTTASYNASVVKIYNATSCQVRFEKKNIFIYIEKTF
jgi:hypothetical protein